MKNAKTNNAVTSRRWPDHAGWDDMANTVEILAKSCGARVYCAQKYEYPPRGFFNFHRDANNESRRVYTFLLYLNDDFEDGETLFQYPDCKIKPKTGRAVFFNAALLHSSSPNIGGEKLVFVSWFCRKSFISWI